MDRYDRLPAELRRWLAGAALPWSAGSALRLWRRLDRETGGDVARMLRRLELAERRMLARDGPRIWGAPNVDLASNRGHHVAPQIDDVVVDPAQHRATSCRRVPELLDHGITDLEGGAHAPRGSLTSCS